MQKLHSIDDRLKELKHAILDTAEKRRGDRSVVLGLQAGFCFRLLFTNVFFLFTDLLCVAEETAKNAGDLEQAGEVEKQVGFIFIRSF